MQNLFLLDPAMGYPFASVSTQAPSITARIMSECSNHFGLPVHAIDATHFENFATLQVLFENGQSIYIDTAIEGEDEEQEGEGPF
jgi:hypothetical protein